MKIFKSNYTGAEIENAVFKSRSSYIVFMIHDGNECKYYFAKNGMTWEEWVGSNYSLSAFALYDNDVNVYYAPNGFIINDVTRSENIKEGYIYSLNSGSGGGN